MSVANPLDGRHAVVTGGARGIGAAIASGLCENGARVTIMGRNEAALRETASRLPDAAGITCDVTSAASVGNAFAKAADSFGPVDILINNAGAARSAPFAATDNDLWEAMLSVNLTGVFNCTRQVAEAMGGRGHGRIVSVASTAGLTGYAYVAAYCAAKHGVIGLTRALALEMARTGVTVNAVCPGFTETDLLAESVANIVEKTGRSAQEARKSLMRTNPQGRFVTPGEVADAVLWLCGDDAGSITGQAIAVAGGEVMT